MARWLYIDDNKDDYEELAASADSAAIIDWAETVRQGLEKMTAHAYDVIVCDLMMPKHNGVYFSNELKLRGIDTPFILTSGVSMLDGFMEYSGPKNYMGFILKPVTAEKIRDLMK